MCYSMIAERKQVEREAISMIIKKFNYKGQMINYYNKVRQNPNVSLCYCCFSCAYSCYIVEYCYKDR